MHVKAKAQALQVLAESLLGPAPCFNLGLRLRVIHPYDL